MPAPEILSIAQIATGGAGEPELAGPVSAPRQAGARTALLPVTPGQIQAVRHDLQPARTFAAGTPPGQADPAGHGALLLPGGAVNAGRWRTGPAVPSLLQQVNGAGKPMAVICHAPSELVPAGPARGQTLTSPHTLQDDPRTAGATRADREAVVHGNLLTSRQPGDTPAVTREMLHRFAAAREA